MTALAFPASPTIYDTYTANGKTWYWDGTSWLYGVGPGAADASIASVTFICNMNTIGRFVNKGSVGGNVTSGTGSVVDTVVKNTPVSSLVNSSTAYGMSSNAGWTFGTGDFTLDFWIYPNAWAAKNIWDFRNAGNSVAPCLYLGADGSLNYFVANATVITGAAAGLALATWSEIEYSKVSGTGRLFINGVQTGSNYTDSNNYTQNGFTLGNGNVINGVIGESGPNAYIGASRITKGVGRHTTTFTRGSGTYSER